MNKNDLVEVMASDLGGTKAEAARALEAFVAAVAGELKNGGQVRIVDFGTFLVSHRKASTGRNPKTGAPITISARNVPKFRPGKGLKATVN